MILLHGLLFKTAAMITRVEPRYLQKYLERPWEQMKMWECLWERLPQVSAQNLAAPKSGGRLN